jgi:hypothetical protein
MSDLRSALRDLAHDDGRRATDMSARVTSRLLAEVRVLQPPSKGAGVARSFGLALAATLLVALAVPLWMVSRTGSRGALVGSDVTGDAAPEVTTAFLPLPYSSVPTRDAQIVRIEVPRAALGTFGLLPMDSVGSVVPGAGPALGLGSGGVPGASPGPGWDRGVASAARAPGWRPGQPYEVPLGADALGRGTGVQGTVVADVIVGEDGLARAVRFVRAPIARTE